MNLSNSIEYQVDELYNILNKKFGNLRDQKTKVAILSYCKQLSDVALEQYEKTKNLDYGIKVIVFADVCQKICSE